VTDQTARPEVDDPRVLALAKARQQIAYESPFNFVCPPWDGLTEQEQHLSLLDARNYLHAALKAGLLAAPAVQVPATDRAAEIEQMRERHKASLRRADEINNSLMEEVQRYAEGSERPVLWSVYNAMHKRALEAEAEMNRLRRMADEVQPASTATLASGLPLVKGNCPGCQRATLFLGTGGYVTCSNSDCPEPDAATTVLEQYGREAHKPEHTWAAELYDPLAEEWVPGTRYPARDRAVNALNHAKRLGPTWKEGRPVERRLVRSTTTHTVEDPA
jgi:hypothetical protein